MSDVALQSDNALANIPVSIEDMEQDAKLGGKMGMADIAIPYVYVLQSNSPQVIPDSEKYIDGAKAGMFYITAMEQVYDGRDEGLTFVPCYFEARINEWIPRDSGGGLVNTYMAEDPIMQRARPNDKGIPALPNGHLLVQTAYHYVLVYVPRMQQYVQCVIPIKSTGLKYSRRMNSTVATTKIPGTNKPAPRFLYNWLMKTEKQQKDQNIWSVINFTQGEIVNKNVYDAAKDYALIAAKGVLRKPIEEHESQHAPSDEVPF